MPGLTNSQLLPYQTGTDRRCDAASRPSEQFKGMWQRFVERFEAKAAPLVQGSRLLDNVPICLVEYYPLDTVNGDVLGNLDIAFNAVQLDNDGMIDLDVDPTSVFPQRAGWYTAFGLLRTTQLDLDDRFGVAIAGGFAGDSTHDNATMGEELHVDQLRPSFDDFAITRTVQAHRFWNPDEAGLTQVQPFSLRKQGTGNYAVQFASLAVVWHSEIQS